MPDVVALQRAGAAAGGQQRRLAFATAFRAFESGELGAVAIACRRREQAGATVRHAVPRVVSHGSDTGAHHLYGCRSRAERKRDAS
jgi:hypothetical protein